MTMHFHECNLSLLSTTALCLGSQAYCVFQAEENIKLLTGRLILLLDDLFFLLTA